METQSDLCGSTNPEAAGKGSRPTGDSVYRGLNPGMVNGRLNWDGKVHYGRLIRMSQRGIQVESNKFGKLVDFLEEMCSEELDPRSVAEEVAEMFQIDLAELNRRCE